MSDNEHENTPNTNPASDAEAPKESPAKLDHWSPVTEAMRTHGDPLFTKRGNPIDPADPGTGLSRLLAIVATILVVAFVVLWQNTPDPTKQAIFYGQTTPEEEAPPEPDQPAPGNFGQVDLMGRIFLRGLDMFKSQNMMSQIEAPGMVFIDEDRVRLIMISAELESTDAALSRLEAFRLEELGFEEEEDPE
ncbi:MAG: hypothetical protein ACF8LL_00775, partial [Phycisphaerales bacterium]